ncbi:MAG TPA: serine hydrolase domain-containing protein [Acidimicrobiia bacterium]|nr:serine hydrolase domain-containing protein [Acidimicrobiia bacterium]
MESVIRHFAPALRKVPAIVVGVLEDDRAQVTALGSVEQEPAPASLCWEIGSITKVFTGLLLAEMSLRGEVGLDDPIGRHLPDRVAARLPSPDRQPTLTHLATHTAGLPRIPWAILRRATGSSDPYARLTEEQVFACLGPKTVRSRRPRSRYSNYGMGLLGHLLARAAGRPYGALVEERLLGPLGMRATGVGSCGEGSAPVPGFRKGKPTPPWTFGALEGAGALRSTAADLLTFARACLDPPAGTLGEALNLARRPFHRKRLPVAAMGLGWMLRHRDRHNCRTGTCWHNGGTYGGSSFLAVDVPRRRAVVALGNTGPRLVPPLDGPSWALFDELLG